jgi:hypothetical protein
VLSSDGNTALIGGFGENGPGEAAWVFARLGSTWTQRVKLTDCGNPLGRANYKVALSSDGNTALVGGVHTTANGGVGAAWAFATAPAETLICPSPAALPGLGTSGGGSLGIGSPSGRGVVGPSAAQIAALLSSQLTPRGESGKDRCAAQARWVRVRLQGA